MTGYILNEALLPRMMQIEKSSFSMPWSEEDVREGFRRGARLRFGGIWDADGLLQGWGCVWIGMEEAHLMTLAIHPDARRKGFGRALLDFLITASADTGCRYMELECRANNTAAQYLYKNRGFIRVGKKPGYYTDTGEDAYIYVLPALPEGRPENDPYLIREDDELDT